ncbi:MAG: hypothetical protein COX38_02155 [Candidatus Nealsonbacteria bacterium CG23_combo_of_CG06-09_8_20_14_all_39_25]|uniref:Homing endonuclease LAGLIDADG domain-containing protein n=4 Tax=Parcubacteria group TaxID=1794811 RepID=A0A2G9YUJ2_9BACT|nr:MAG: hypothetical protein COX38_02155 [Candidatus Nealsonbacteria bacterium CG23_combo_of_CG06-09_8_20_14_all_39_25]PIW90400.1 MAG: hypothetical protein COZ92_00765 [Candidatus Nealsonbacteria bacterium CG_4_8_14_3_um_filter_40_11]PIX92232.1 MAG: hypothetical protein COZ26_02915 [Candidatus Kuenenbacteria bacterium CG_4_10_14_3_um_filter_39_14]PIZ88178.1 MAG: hypothetical protein COX91_01530 [Candidatus Nealsonbacteria bacterium CG_4_10_14_0_2_um_filter_39_15]
MGRQIKLKQIDFAYIAGFLDGDGSIMFQIKKRKDTLRGKRLMFTICFYQDTRHEKPLFWIKNRLGIGYISRRNDGITELRVNGHKQVQKILQSLYPYLRFKKEQVRYLFRAINILNKRKIDKLTKKEKKEIVNALIAARKQTYQSGKKNPKKLKADLKVIMAL